MDENAGILYSADLFLCHESGVGQVIEALWEDEVSAIAAARVPAQDPREKLQGGICGGSICDLQRLVTATAFAFK